MAIVPSKFERKRPEFGSLKGPLETYFTFAVAGGAATSSIAFVDYPGPIDKTIIKRDTATAIFVSGFAGGFKSVTVGNIEIGILINGVDYFLGGFFYNTLSEHNVIPFNLAIASGLTAGSYSTRLRWRVSAGNANSDSNDRVQIRFEEGYFA